MLLPRDLKVGVNQTPIVGIKFQPRRLFQEDTWELVVFSSVYKGPYWNRRTMKRILVAEKKFFSKLLLSQTSMDSEMVSLKSLRSVCWNGETNLSVVMFFRISFLAVLLPSNPKWCEHQTWFDDIPLVLPLCSRQQLHWQSNFSYIHATCIPGCSCYDFHETILGLSFEYRKRKFVLFSVSDKNLYGSQIELSIRNP